LAKAAEKAVKDWWKEEATESVREQAENAVKNDWGIDISSWKSIWDRQRENFIEGMGIFWVICPWGTNRTDHEEVISAWTKDNPMGFLTDLQKMLSDMKAAGYPPNVGMVYHLLSSFAGRGLTARKNLRNFTQIHEPGHKCSLCGKWEALHPKFSDLACTKQVTGKIKSEEIRNKPDEQSHSHRWLSAFWEALGEISRNGGQLKLKGRIRRGDRLCSFCLTRRLALEAFFVKKLGLDWHLFPSTAGIATAAYRGRILEEVMKGDLGLEQALDSYSEVIKKFILEQDLPYPAAFPAFLKEWAAKSKKGEEFLKIDGDWLFVSSFDLQALKRSYPIDSLKEIDAKKEVVRKLNQAAKNLGSPPRYYAILAVDADKMGDWLTSARAPWFRWLFHANLRDEDRVRPLTFPRPLGPALQLALSDSLKNFALYRVRRIVEKDHAGKLIYAGGDDALAFLPLEHLFHVMEKLYLSFRGRNNGFEIEGLEILRLMGGVRPGTSIDIPHRGITISMGVVIAHHTFPLYQAMQEVQKVLKEVAKGALGRNAFAIRLMRRSGEHTETGFCFTSQGSAKECDILEKMDKILEYFQEGTLSTRLPYEMAENRWAELSPDEDKYQGLDQARQNELVRITGRHTKIGFEKKTSGLILSLFKDLNKGIKGFDPHKDKDVQVDAWKTMSDFLQILRFITGKGE
jgi:CRISPR-associated protein Cmr2